MVLEEVCTLVFKGRVPPDEWTRFILHALRRRRVGLRRPVSGLPLVTLVSRSSRFVFLELCSARFERKVLFHGPPALRHSQARPSDFSISHQSTEKAKATIATEKDKPMRATRATSFPRLLGGPRARAVPPRWPRSDACAAAKSTLRHFVGRQCHGDTYQAAGPAMLLAPPMRAPPGETRSTSFVIPHTATVRMNRARDCSPASNVAFGSKAAARFSVGSTR